jgi:hypothetical protein
MVHNIGGRWRVSFSQWICVFVVLPYGAVAYNEHVTTEQLQVVSTRDQITSFLDQAEGLELGVRRGVFSEELLKSGRLTHLTGIDAWQDAARKHYIKEYVQALKRLRPFRENVTVVRAFFDEVPSAIPDASMDFIYIDGYAHTGGNRGKDFAVWWPKLKSGGIFSGHDYGGKYKLIKKYLDIFYKEKQLQGVIDGVLLVTRRGDKIDNERSWYFKKA